MNDYEEDITRDVQDIVMSIHQGEANGEQLAENPPSPVSREEILEEQRYDEFC